LFTGFALSALLILGVGCSPEESGIPASVIDREAAAPLIERQASTPAEPPSSGGNALDDIRIVS
jgi:hypothetical protein